MGFTGLLQGTIRDARRLFIAASGRAVLPDIDPRAWTTIRRVQPYSMTSTERLYGLIQAVRYVTRFGVGGHVVECGVWRGGSMMAVALTLLESGVTDRDLYLFDTFSGMSTPSDEDRQLEDGKSAAALLGKASKASGIWALASKEEVKKNMEMIGYPATRIHLIEGKVEDTIPDHAPEEIALLRLDTDWYESTKHELEHLIRRVSPQGVLIVDDYGHWAGARKAVDEWLEKLDRPVLLNRLDYTGRIAVLP